MTAEMRCEQVRDLAPELALDIAAGEERDAALRHLPGCPDCRRLVSELSSVIEELLLLAPVHEPPPGFESRVVRALTGPAELASVEPLRRSRRWRGLVAVAASLLLAAAVGAGAALVSTSEDRMLAADYRAVLREGQGSSFTAAPLRGAEGRAGSVFGYEGRPSWIVVTLPERRLREDTYTVTAITRDGRYVDLGAATLGGDHRVWGHEIPVDLTTVHQLRFVASDGRTALTALTATFSAASPWA
ncbi:MAG: hypothetical protein ACRDG8_03465 [Actinomycetota bacterium]